MDEEIINFCIDEKKMEITFYLTEDQMRVWAKEAVRSNKSVDQLTEIITTILAKIAKGLCKKLELDFDKMIPKVELIKE